MFTGSPRNSTRITAIMLLYASCSSFQGHVQWIPTLKFTESLRMRHYSNIALPKPLELSNYCSVIDTQSRWLLTADCSPSWTSWTIKTYISFKFFFFVPESKLILISMPFFYQKKQKTKNKKYGFRRFHGLLITG